ncbi:MAG: hypothetical protein HEEMFOPI_01812 [Holosporales bacterium]
MKQNKKRLTPIEQIEKLKLQQQTVQKTFESKITTLLKKEKVYNHDFTLLYGAILDICQKLNDQQNNNTQISSWEKIEITALEKKKKSEKTEQQKKENHSDLDNEKNRKTLKPIYNIFKKVKTDHSILNSKITDLQKRINDLELKKNVIKTQKLNVSKSERKKRTRTLIQAGALLNMMGFFDLCDIKEGDDLELDIESKDKAAVLLGMLESLKNTLPNYLETQDLENFKNIGIRVLKMRGKT